MLSRKDGLINKSFNNEQRIAQSLKNKKLRLGICSSFLHEHSVTKCYLNLIEDFSKSGTEIIHPYIDI